MGSCALYGWGVLQFGEASALEESGFRGLLVGTAVSFILSIGLLIYGWKGGSDILRRDTMVIVGLSWILSPLIGAIPFVLCDPGLPLIKAIFESVSGLTTTGSTVMSDIEAFPKSVLLWRSVLQYLGGIGIVVLFIAVFAFLGFNNRSLISNESSLNIADSKFSRIADTAKFLLIIYLVLTLLCGGGLVLLGMPVFEAVCHAMTTIATGGFSPKNASIGHYDSVPIEAFISFFMVLSSVSFMLYIFAFRRNFKRLKLEEEAKWYLLMLVLCILAIATNLSMAGEGYSWSESFVEVFFNIVSISTTTGYAASDYDQWPLFSRMVLIILMVIGGCAGSTAGGLKMNRVILFAKLAVRELVLTFRPNQVIRVNLNGKSSDKNIHANITILIALSFVLSGLSCVLVALFEPGLDLLTVFGTVMATIFNTGPGFEGVGPTDHFGNMSNPTLVLLCLLMTIGRLEFFAILVLFLPQLWKRY